MDHVIKKTYEIEIVSLSPLHAGAGRSVTGYESTMKRGGRSCIPATTIKGKWRDNFRSLTGEDCRQLYKRGADDEALCGCMVCRLFGGEGFMPSRIFVSDFVDAGSGGFSIRSTVAVDRYVRTVKDGALAFCEVSEDGKYTGEISVYFTAETLPYERELLASLEMIDSIGKNKSRGMGFVKVNISERQREKNEKV